MNEKNIYYFLKIAVDNLIIIHNSLIQSDLVKLKKYSLMDLQNEISEFIDYYVPFKKIINFDPDEFLNCWNDIFLEENFEFTNFVHKDYEHINLIYLNKNAKHLSCGIIDFQSAYLGFIGWDLFSILEYSRLNFSNKFNEELIKYFYDNVNIKIKYKVFRNQYYILNLARQTRLLGRWVKLYNSNHKKEYLNFIDTTKERIILSLNNIQNNKKLKKIYKKCSLTHD